MRNIGHYIHTIGMNVIRKYCVEESKVVLP